MPSIAPRDRRILVVFTIAVLTVGALTAVLGRSDGGEPRAAIPREPVARENRPVQFGAPRPADHPAGTPRRAAAEFLDAWHDREWARMARWSSPLWRRLPHPARSLRFRYGRADLGGVHLSRLRDTGPDTAHLDVGVALTRAGRVQRRWVTMELRRVRGRWTVDPVFGID